MFAQFTAKENSGNQMWLEAGKPMLYAGGAKGITLDRENLCLKVVDVEGGDWEAAGVIVHEPKNRSVAHMLVEMPFGAFPTALGVLYEDPAPTFESAVVRQNEEAAAGKKADLQALVSKGQSWMVTKEPHAI